MADSPDPVAETLREANELLEAVESKPFSPQGFVALRVAVTRHIAELIAESRKVAKRYRADTISAAHVERANEYLITSTTRRFWRHVGTIGGIFLGACVSITAGMFVTERFPVIGILTSIGFGILGAFLTALHIGRDQ